VALVGRTKHDMKQLRELAGSWFQFDIDTFLMVDCFSS
jgi:hypothetical protein